MYKLNNKQVVRQTRRSTWRLSTGWGDSSLRSASPKQEAQHSPEGSTPLEIRILSKKNRIFLTGFSPLDRLKHLMGFTLIELLVVIAIIALLMAILMPSLQRVRKQAKGIICRSNLKQYGIATRMYLDDNQGSFPYVNTWLFKDGTMGCQWHDSSRNLNLRPHLAGVLWPYLKNKDIHLCLIFNAVARQTGCRRCGGKIIPVEPQYGYVMNPYLNGDILNMVPKQYQAAVKKASKELGVKNPAKVFLFSEENTWTIQGLSSDSFNDNSLHAMPAPIIDDCFATFHDAPSGDLNNGFANAVFVDWHVDRVSAWPVGNTFKLSWPGGSPIPSW